MAHTTAQATQAQALSLVFIGADLFNKSFQVRLWTQPVEVDSTGLTPHTHQQAALAATCPPLPQHCSSGLNPFHILITHLQHRTARSAMQVLRCKAGDASFEMQALKCKFE